MSKTIIKSSRELTELEQYILTLDPSAHKMSDVEPGTTIEVAYWALFEHEREGEVTEVLAIGDSKGNAYNTNSNTFKRSFADIVSVAGNDGYNIIVLNGDCKRGKYIDCALDKQSLIEKMSK